MPRTLPKWPLALVGVLPLLSVATYLVKPEPVAKEKVFVGVPASAGLPTAAPAAIPTAKAPQVTEVAPLPRPVADVAIVKPEEIPEPAKPSVVPQIVPLPRHQVRYQLPLKHDTKTTEQLELDLLYMREVKLNTSAKPMTGAMLQAAASRSSPRMPYAGPVALGKSRPEIAGLPFLMANETLLTKAQAEEMDKYSKELRSQHQKSLDAEQKLNVEKFYISLKPTADAPATLAPCVRQMLQCESESVRRFSCELLRDTTTPEATAALVQWAIFDTDSGNRAAALDAHRARDREAVTALIVPFLRYPWVPAVEHACEALVALEAKEAVSAVLAAKNTRDPEAAYSLDLPHNTGGTFRREVVRINHARNCLLCHEPAEKAGTLTAAIPSESAPLPPSNSTVYYSASRDLVKASTTYLRQDFSQMQPVENHGPWPKMQRYDYFVSVQRVSYAEGPSGNAGRYRMAYDYALKNLGAEDAEAAPRGDDLDYAATARFVSQSVQPEALASLKAGLDLFTATPIEVETALYALQHKHSAKPLRLALAAYFAEAAERGSERAGRMLAAVKGKALDVDLPLTLAKLAK